MTLVGFTALSVEIITKRVDAAAAAGSARHRVPSTLFFTASHGFSSMSGTCLCAAAWKTMSGR